MAERVSHLAIELASDGSDSTRVSQAVAELASDGSDSTRVSQAFVELAAQTVATTRASQAIVEMAILNGQGLRVFINGTEVDALLSTFEIRETANGTSTMICDIDSSGSPVYRPELFDEILVTENATRIFAGHITHVRERGMGGPNLYDADDAPSIVTEVSASDYTSLTQRRYVTLTIAGSPASDVATVLQDLVDDYLTDYGVTLHPAQATGPDLPALSFERVTIARILDAIADAADGYVWGIDYHKRLRMWQPGDLAAPFDIDEYDDPANWTGDVEVERSLSDKYANRVIIVGDEIEDQFHVEEFTATGVETSYTVEWEIIAVPQGFVEVRGGSIPSGDVDRETCTIVGGDDAQWHFNPDTGVFTRYESSVSEVEEPLEAGQTVTFTFYGRTSPTAQADDAGEQAAHGIWEHVESRSGLSGDESAEAVAEAILTERVNSADMTVTYQTRRIAPNLRAGQVQTITAVPRDLSGDFLVTEMSVRCEVPLDPDDAAPTAGIIRRVTARRSQTVAGDWRETYKAWSHQ